MTIKQIQYFLAIVDYGNMTRAAKELFVSQPTLSLSMKELEKEVGVQLFAHADNHLVLTAAGKELKKEFSHLIRVYRDTEERIRSGGLNRQSLRLGFSTVVGNIPAAEICSAFCNAYPQIHLETVEDYGHHLLSRLLEGTLDCVITGSSYAERSEWKDCFSSALLNTDSLCYFVPKNHPLAHKESVTLEEISAQSIIMLSDEYPISWKIEDEFQRRGVPLHIILRTSQMYTVERFIAGGAGCGFLPSGTAATDAQIACVPCLDADFFMSMHARLYWKKSERMEEAVRLFVKTAGERYGV